MTWVFVATWYNVTFFGYDCGTPRECKNNYGCAPRNTFQVRGYTNSYIKGHRVLETVLWGEELMFVHIFAWGRECIQIYEWGNPKNHAPIRGSAQPLTPLPAILWGIRVYRIKCYAEEREWTPPGIEPIHPGLMSPVFNH
jgi:hypothetical protein